MNTKTLISAIILTILILSVPVSATTISSSKGSGGSGVHNSVIDFIRNSVNVMSITIPCQSGYVYCYEQNYIYGNAQAMARIYVSNVYLGGSGYSELYVNFKGDGTKFYKYRGITSWSQIVCDENGCNGQQIGSNEQALLGSYPTTPIPGVVYVVWDTNTYDGSTAWTWVGSGWLEPFAMEWSNSAIYPTGIRAGSSPGGADVYIDGIWVSKSDWGKVIIRPPGTYNVKIEYPPFPASLTTCTLISKAYGDICELNPRLAGELTLKINDTSIPQVPIEGATVIINQQTSTGLIYTETKISDINGIVGTFFFEKNVPLTVKISKLGYQTYSGNMNLTTTGSYYIKLILYPAIPPKINAPIGFTTLIDSIWSFLKTIFPGLN